MHATATSTLIPEMLKEYGAITQAALVKYLPDREPKRYLYDIVADYPQRSGKMMRPSLCIATARAFGANLEDALATAVSIELLHNALLIHDDIQDESDERRGKSTLHKLHGIPLAINAGDTLSLLSLRPLISNVSTLGSRLSSRVFDETMHMALETAEGQALELGWRYENRIDLDDEDYLIMVLKKTCWLATIFPMRAGALIGSRDTANLENLTRFGFFLGAAFQIQDDLLNLIGDERYGKELNGDIQEGKRTLMLLHLIKHATVEQREELHLLLGSPREQRSAAQIQWVRTLMDKYGCIEYAREIAHGLAGAAKHEYTMIFSELPSSRDKDFIEGLVTWVFERT
ncbi:MAG: geranylgeranyl diphosphate synthase type II [Granulosicoccus sp.]|jgi:geranylgeranyl diphosphate synthase type II